MNVMGDEGIHPRARRRSPTRLFFEGKDESKKTIVPPWTRVRQESLADLVSCEVLTM